MTICRLLMRAELRHALWMIKGGVRVEKDSPQEAHQRINKQTSTDPFSLQLGLFWFPNWFVFPLTRQRKWRKFYPRQTRSEPARLWAAAKLCVKCKNPVKRGAHYWLLGRALGFVFIRQPLAFMVLKQLLWESISVFGDWCQMTNQHLEEAYTNGEARWCPQTDVPKHSALISSKLRR